MGNSDIKEEPISKKIMATVYLRSKTGLSLLEERKNTIDPTFYLSSSETSQRAVLELKKRGFTIEAQGVTLSISGPPELFEKIFDVKISLEEIKSLNGTRPYPESWFVYRSSNPVMQIKELEDIIEGVVLAKPGAPF